MHIIVFTNLKSGICFQMRNFFSFFRRRGFRLILLFNKKCRSSALGIVSLIIHGHKLVCKHCRTAIELVVPIHDDIYVVCTKIWGTKAEIKQKNWRKILQRAIDTMRIKRLCVCMCMCNVYVCLCV